MTASLSAGSRSAGPSSDWGRTTAQSGGPSRKRPDRPRVARGLRRIPGDPTPNGLLTISLLAAAWVVAFRSAFAAGHYTVDSTITVAIGTVTGLVLASALNEWVPGLGLTVPRLLATAAAIFGLVSVWEWLVRRAGMTSVARARGRLAWDRRRARRGSAEDSRALRRRGHRRERICAELGASPADGSVGGPADHRGDRSPGTDRARGQPRATPPSSACSRSRAAASGWSGS